MRVRCSRIYPWVGIPVVKGDWNTLVSMTVGSLQRQGQSLTQYFPKTDYNNSNWNVVEVIRENGVAWGWTVTDAVFERIFQYSSTDADWEQSQKISIFEPLSVKRWLISCNVTRSFITPSIMSILWWIPILAYILDKAWLGKIVSSLARSSAAQLPGTSLWC